jgi:hypothetical protein
MTWQAYLEDVAGMVGKTIGFKRSTEMGFRRLPKIELRDPVNPLP